MIVTEKLTINGKLFLRNYSDKGVLIERDGVLYEEAIDLAHFERQYTETDTKIEEE